MKLLVAVMSATLVAVGVGLESVPAGLVVAGLEGLGGLYVASYLEARR